MKRRLLTALMGFAPIVTVPDKWHLDRERSAAMTTSNRGVSHFGNAPSIDVIEAYFPVEIGMGLVASRYTTTALPDGRDAAIAAVVGELEKWGGDGIVEKTHDRKSVDKVLEVVVGGKEPAAQMAYTTRLVVAADATSVVAVIGQCFERDDANIAHVSDCRKALLTLDTGIAITDRADIAFPGAPAAPIEGTGSNMRLPAQLTDGSKINFAPIQLPPPPVATDRRPIYIGVGVVVLAVALWWQRRQREKFDRDDGGRSTNDDDDDALHAAAKAPDDEKKGNDA